jgi:hypothetical protein
MYKGKGIIFVGCSFTWGGGLEYYPPFKDIPNPYAFQYDEKNITFAIMNFIKANRFSRLVANHFGMWEANRLNCGGSDDGSVDQIKMMLGLGHHNHNGHVSKQFENIKMQRYSADEIDCVVFQLTDPFRNYHINVNGEPLVVNIAQIRQRDTNEFNRNDINKFKDTLDNDTFNTFFKFYTDNFNSWEEMENYFILENLKLVIELFKEVESLGIKCKLWSWHNEYVPFIKENDYLLSKFIKLKYEDTEFDCLYDLMKKHPKFKISTSGFLVNGKPVPDDHQTIECHKIIADSIINSIENDAIETIV